MYNWFWHFLPITKVGLMDIGAAIEDRIGYLDRAKNVLKV